MALAPHIESQIAALTLAHSLPDDAVLTLDQRVTLQQFSGWGALAPAFAKEPKGQWLTVADLLEEAVPEAALRRASEQLDTSFFTPLTVTTAVFELLASTGFTGGTVLEPGCGSGTFMAAAPAELDITWTGVEVDPTSARIAQLMNPDAEILFGKLETTVLRDGHFDAAIGNVPFSSVRVRDKEGRSGALHNYFIERAVDAVRPGGYVILVTSRHTIDSQTGILDSIRNMDGAALIGAIRLPSGAFADAGTEAVTDIIVIRRNDPTCTRRPYTGPADFETVDAGWDSYNGRTRRETHDLRTHITTPDVPGQTIAEPAVVSRYWEHNPQHVAGAMRSTTFARSPLVVRSTHPAQDIADAVATLASELPPLAPRLDITDLSDVILEDTEGRKAGSFHNVDGTLCRVDGGKLTPIRANKELSELITLRDLAVQLLDAESDPHAPGAQIAPLRESTRDAYNAYVKRFGNLNRGTLVEGRVDEETGLPALSWRRPAMGGFRRDPDAPLVMALEVYDQETGEAGPAPILLHRVNHAPQPIEHVDTPAEALAVSMGESGRVNLARIASLLSLGSEEDAERALGELVFDDGYKVVSAAEFLSGNVRRKLADAERRGDARAVEALRAVVPAELGPLEIKMALGSPFVRPSDVEAFLQQEMGVRWPSVHRADGIGVWEVGDAQSDAAALMQYGTADAAPWYLVECALNARMPEITDREWNAERATWVQVRNPQKSAAANEKLELIRDRFSTWVWEDEERAARISSEYNEKLNSHVPRTYSGTGLTFPGLAVDFTPWAHQRAAVERIASTPRALLGHPVGAGKAQPMDSLILTPSGFRRMADFMVGDEVIAPDGSTTTITGVFPQGAKDVYRVVFSDGAVVECNDEHLWNVQTINMRSDSPDTWHTLTLREVMDRGLTNGRNQPFWLVPIAEAADFDCGESRPLEPYLVGALLGDGSVTTGAVKFTSADAGVLDEVRSALPAGVQLVKSSASREYDYAISLIESSNRRYTNPVIEGLRDLGMMGHDARHKSVPQAYLEAPRAVRIAVLQGLMDTDGYVKALTSRGAIDREVGCSIEFGSSSPRLIADVSWLVRSLGGVVTPHQSRKTVNGVVHTRVRFKLPEGINPFRLARKADIYRPAQHYTPRRAIKSVELVGRKPMQCISVAHDDHLYITDDFVVTHNTAEMVMAARTLRQFALANKPLIVVPNHLLEQISREAQQTFPTGRFLIASKDDLARDARRLFAARCATGDWDAVIMTHSAFTSIPVHPDAEEAWLADEAFDLRMALQNTEGGRKEKGPKAISRAIRALEARVAKLRDNGATDHDAIFFEQLGVDYIMVDEAHLFRRLATNSTSRDNGFGSGSSKRATDLLVKVETLAGRRPAGAPIVALFTGTPWSNTLAESWVWQRLLQPDALRDLDLLAFDAWVSAFIRYETNIEVAPDGSGFRLQRRPVGMVNFPEFKMLFAQVADILDPDKLGLHRPTHTVSTVVVDPTPEQRTFVQGLAERADAIRSKTAAKRTTLLGTETDDSMLLVCNDGRKVALDPRLVGIDESSAKIGKLAELISAAYHDNALRTFGSHPTPGAFQLVFLDLGTPKPGEASTYGRLRRGLVDLGVPAQMIRFVHDATTDKARAALFASCRDGEVAVLIASTSKAGMGTNVQTRLSHLWHADAPWLPSDVIQRDGRAIRPGNLTPHVQITRVVTEGTFDAYTWQTLERKSRSFDALYATGATAREIEDVSAASISYGEVKALASGNPLLLDQATARAEVKKLELMRSVHMQSVRKAEQTAKMLDERVTGLGRAVERGRDAIKAVQAEATADQREQLGAIVDSWVAAQKGANGYGMDYRSTQKASWRGLELRPQHQDGRLDRIDVELRYATIDSFAIAPKLARRGGAVVTTAVAEAADRIMDALPRKVDEWAAQAKEYASRADESRFAAATSSFPDEAKLAAAVARLAQIDALIAEDAAVRERVAA